MTTAKKRKGVPIWPINLSNGEVRYEVMWDGPPRPDGRRRQLTKRFPTMREAEAHLAKVKTEVREGTFISPDKMTVRAHLDAWLEGRRKIRPSTRAGYKDALSPVYESAGDLPLQALTPQVINNIVNTMATTGGRKGTGRSPRTIVYMLTVLQMAMDSAVAQKLIAYNPAVKQHVERPTQRRAELGAWTPEQVQTYLNHVAEDRHVAAWRLTFLGMRRSEVLGLTWGRVDLDAGLITIDRARTVGPAGGPRTVVDEPKSQRSRRVIPLPPDVVAALRTTKRQQQVERLALGRPLADTDLVVVDAAGRGVDPDTYSKAFKAHLKAAGLPEIRLHDARRTAATLLHVAYGVPANAAASYLGHDPATYNGVYVRGDQGHDLVAAALSKMQAGATA